MTNSLRPSDENAAAAAAVARAQRVRVRGGNPRRVLEAAAAAGGESAAVLALVLETEGSTYADPGALALFGAGAGQAGWLSGGCLEPEIARRAAEAAVAGGIGWLEVDTRDDEDLLSGSALGCRGRLRLALLPLRLLPGIDAVFDRWLQGGAVLRGNLARDGRAWFGCGGASALSPAGAEACLWPGPRSAWRLDWRAPPELLLLGAGPETDLLLPLLRALGWRTTLAERRARWRDRARLADRHVDAVPAAALAQGAGFDAALVMHHDFELDRDALERLASSAIGFIGLLGPVRRREDLFKLLPAAQREALQSRLHSPVGLDLGGRGAEAIALSIAAQLQAWRHAADIAG